MTLPNSTAINNPFTQSWIQALTMAAENPLARTIKPKLDWVEALSTARPDTAGERVEAASKLWEFSQSEGLQSLLWHLPVNSSPWCFDEDDIFAFRRGEVIAHDSPQASFEAWSGALGITAGSFPLVAEVTGSDWAGLVRKEAVRLQHSLDTTAVPQGSNLELPCTAHWDGHAWRVQFVQVDWIEVSYDENPTITRPPLSELQDKCMWLLTQASDALISKKSSQCGLDVQERPWHTSAPQLAPLHLSLREQARDFSPWICRVWNCVWPIVYREVGVLAGKADLDAIRPEIKACLTIQPRLTMWMFVFAKLVCQAQIARGLGVSADFRHA
ncbi:MAG: hypothetical protein R3C53_24835 [Pirellulaceae bacterium]